MSFDYINKNRLGVKNGLKGTKKFQELMKDPEWRKQWYDKSMKASHAPEVEERRSATLIKTIQERGSVWTGREHTNETKAKMSESAKNRMARCGNPAQGKVWVYNETLKENKSIPSSELQSYLDKGWLKGRKMKF